VGLLVGCIPELDPTELLSTLAQFKHHKNGEALVAHQDGTQWVSMNSHSKLVVALMQPKRLNAIDLKSTKENKLNCFSYAEYFIFAPLFGLSLYDTMTIPRVGFIQCWPGIYGGLG